MTDTRTSKELSTDELLDELAGLAEHWQRLRAQKFTPQAIRTAMLGVISEIKPTAEPAEPPKERVEGIAINMRRWLELTEKRPLDEYRLDRDAVAQIVARLAQETRARPIEHTAAHDCACDECVSAENRRVES